MVSHRVVNTECLSQNTTPSLIHKEKRLFTGFMATKLVVVTLHVLLRPE
jgi:hypothetical protein